MAKLVCVLAGGQPSPAVASLPAEVLGLSLAVSALCNAVAAALFTLVAPERDEGARGARKRSWLGQQEDIYGTRFLAFLSGRKIHGVRGGT